MRAFLLAGGIGSRLRPLTLTVPKCLVRIHGRPLLDYWLDLIFAAGIDRALINTHWLPDVVRHHVAASRWRDRIDLVHEIELLGTGGSVLANRDYFADGPFLVAHADNLTNFDVHGLVQAHASAQPQAAITMLAFKTDDPRSCGILELDDRGFVVGFHEKVEDPPGDLANGAVYIFQPEILDFLRAFGRPVIDLSTEVLPAYKNRILAVQTSGYHRDIGNMTALARAELEFPKMQSKASS